jgi:hypothetical protein
MDSGAVLTPAEETGNAAVGGNAAREEASDRVIDALSVHAPDGAAASSPPDGDPWRVLMAVGAQFVAALATANGSAAAGTAPIVEHDPATGLRHLKLPMPPPEAVRGLADALATIADSLRRAVS